MEDMCALHISSGAVMAPERVCSACTYPMPCIKGDVHPNGIHSSQPFQTLHADAEMGDMDRDQHAELVQQPVFLLLRAHPTYNSLHLISLQGLQAMGLLANIGDCRITSSRTTLELDLASLSSCRCQRQGPASGGVAPACPGSAEGVPDARNSSRQPTAQIKGAGKPPQ